MNKEFQEIYDLLNKNGEMEQTYNNRWKIKDILQAENIDALIQVLDYTEYDRVKDWNLIETFDLIKQKYPNKAEIVDSIQIKKNIGSMLYFPYYSAEEEFNKTQSLDDIIKYIQNIDDANRNDFNVYRTLDLIARDYPQKAEVVKSMQADFINPETYSSLGAYYRGLQDLIKTYPEKTAEYLQLIQNIDVERNTAEDLVALYEVTQHIIKHKSSNYGNNKNLEKHIQEYPEILKQITQIYLSTFTDAQDEQSVAKALKIVEAIYNISPEKGFDLIKQFYDMSVKTGASLNDSGFGAVIDAVINEDISKAQAFLEWEKNMLDSGHEGDLNFYPHLLKIREKYPELLPQIHDLIKQEAQINVNNWEVFHQKYLAEIAKPQEDDLKSAADAMKSMQKKQEHNIGTMLSRFKVLTDVNSANFALDVIQNSIEKIKFEETRERYGLNPLNDTYEAVNAILQGGGNASYEKGLKIVQTGLENNNHQLSSALDILKTISAKPEYLDECIDLTKLMHNNEDSENYGDRNISEEKAEFLCKIMEDHPEKINKCLPILLEMLPTSYEKPKPVSKDDEFGLLSDDDEQEKKLSKEEIIAQNVIKYPSELSKIAKSILNVAPEKFADCLPSLQKVANDGSSDNQLNVMEISRQFMASHPSECAELFVTCLDKHSYGSRGNTKFANNVLESMEQLVDIKPALNQEAQQQLVDNIHEASYYTIDRSSYYYDDDDYAKDKKVWKGKRNEMYLKMMHSEAFSEATGMSIISKVDKDEKEFFAQILTEKLCTSGQVIQILTKLEESIDYDEIEKITKQNYADNTEVKEALKAIKNERRNKKIIDDVLNEYPAGQKIEALIRLADAVVKTKDDKQINQFKDMLFCKGEEYVFDIDKKAMDWFVNNGKPEDLEALNNLSQLYGIKTDLSEYWTVDPAQNAAYRIRFDGGYSEIGAVQYDRDLDEEVSNPHYYRMLSEAYQKFKPDYSRDFKPSEYNLHENKAFQTLVHKGVKMPIKMLQAAFVEIHMPPEIAKELNATDLQHLLVNYTHHKNGLDHDSDYDMESSENLSERIKEERRGDRIGMQAVSSKAPAAIREKLWKSYARNKQLVEFVNKDWERMGISDDIIADTWANAKEIGAPVTYYGRKASHYGMRNTLHHALALRVGGTNDQSIVITNNIQKAGEEEEDRWSSSDGDYYTVNKDGGNFYINSHDPFHHYDNPCVYLYLKASDGKLSVRDKYDGRMKKRMMITRMPSAKLNDGDKIVYYGGPRECSCAIMDKEGNVRQASYDFWKDDPSKDRQQINVVAKDFKIRPPCSTEK